MLRLFVAVSGLIALVLASTSQAQQPDAQLRPGVLVNRIETRQGKVLPGPQRREVMQAHNQARQEMLEVETKYIRAIARVVGLTEKQMRELLPLPGQPADFEKVVIPKIEAQRGKPLTPEERNGIKGAQAEKKTGMEAVQDHLAQRVARIARMKQEEVRQMLPEPGSFGE